MTVNENSKPLLTVKGLKQYFKVSNNYTVHAVENVSFQIYPGETYGLVGESGSGKSTIGRSIIRLYDPTAGEINFNGMDISGRINKANSQALRTQMQMIFQDPYSSLNPRMSVYDTIAEMLRVHKVVPAEELPARVEQLLTMSGLTMDIAERFPGEFSGGQRQRIGIARAIALQPDLIVCDEPVSALDVSVQSQVLNLLKDLQKQYGLTYLFIGHDLSVINFIADRVCVMFLGHVCEVATKEELYSRPMHPYTAFLMDAIPQADPHRRNQHRRVLMGEVPSPVNLPSGCCFHTRCPYATERCRTEVPELREWDGRMVACHRAGENWD